MGGAGNDLGEVGCLQKQRDCSEGCLSGVRMRIVKERFDRVVELASDTPACVDRSELVLAVVLNPVLVLAAGVLTVGGRVGDLSEPVE